MQMQALEVLQFVKLRGEVGDEQLLLHWREIDKQPEAGEEETAQVPHTTQVRGKVKQAGKIIHVIQTQVLNTVQVQCLQDIFVIISGHGPDL